MRLGFDLDGVLADLHGTFAKTARELFPGLDPSALASPRAEASPPSEDGEAGTEVPESAPLPALTRAQSRAVWDRFGQTENFWETLDEIEPGTIARLWTLATERRWEIIFLTSRPFVPGLTLQRQTQRWLQRHGFPLPSVFIVQQSRGRIADALQLDAVVDDRPEGCLDVVLESKARAILVWRGDPATVPASAKRLGIGVVPSMTACLEVLAQADEEGDQAGMMSKLRRLLGLRPKAT